MQQPEPSEINAWLASKWFGLGFQQREIGNYNTAVASFDQSLALDSNNLNIWYNRGIALERLGRYEEALVSYNKAIELQPNYYQAWDN